MEPYKYGKSRLVSKRTTNQGKLIHEDSNTLIDKESKGTLSEDEIPKFKLLIGREPKIRDTLKNTT